MDLEALIYDVTSRAINDALKAFKEELKPQDEDEYLTTAQALKFLGISNNTLVKFRENGSLNYINTGRGYRYLKSDLINLSKVQVEKDRSLEVDVIAKRIAQQKKRSRPPIRGRLDGID